jgi:kinesin family member 17
LIGSTRVVQVENTAQQIQLYKPGEPEGVPRSFTFDVVYGEDS